MLTLRKIYMTQPLPKKLTRKRNRSDHSPIFWESEHDTTHHKITIQQKVDRNLIMVVHEQSRQVLMVKMSLFGHISDETCRLEPEHDVTKKTLAFLAPIALEFAAGKVERKDLIQLRDEKLLSLGLDRKSVRKRPAADDLEPVLTAPVRKKALRAPKSTEKQEKPEEATEEPEDSTEKRASSKATGKARGKARGKAKPRGRANKTEKVAATEMPEEGTEKLDNDQADDESDDFMPAPPAMDAVDIFEAWYRS